MKTGGPGGLGDLSGLLRQAQKVKEEMGRINEELAEVEIEGEAAQGRASAIFTGSLELKSIRLDPSLLEEGDISLIEDVVTAAVRQGLTRAQEISRERMSRLTGGTDLPGFFQ